MPPSKAQQKNTIDVVGARVNNLKDVSVSIPRNAFVVITGLSGSGKSSLAFDTIYAEANRRYVESLSSYARNFLDGFEKPDVDAIHNLSPAISIDQKSVSRSPRSTVGTMTEVYDYLRVLYAKYGQPHCPSCGKKLSRRSARAILDEILEFTENVHLTFVAVSSSYAEKGEAEALRLIETWGYMRVYRQGELMTIEEALRLPDLTDDGSLLQVVVDRMEFDTDSPDKERILDSIETAFHVGQGTAVLLVDQKLYATYHDEYRCESCGVQFEELTPSYFSFNNPLGACAACDGLGKKLELEEELVIPNPALSLEEGAVRPWSKMHLDKSITTGPFAALVAGAKAYKISLSTPWKKLKKKDRELLWHGSDDEKKGFSGIFTLLQDKYHSTKSEHVRKEIERYMSEGVCPECQGKRLSQVSLGVTLGDKSIADITSLSVEETREILAPMLEQAKVQVAHDARLIDSLFSEVQTRLLAIEKVGLGYLSLSRGADTLSGGEAQRIRLSVQMKSGLSGIIYVLDEPSVGLHSRDTEKLITSLQELKEANNSLVVVEHDTAIMKAADYIVDMGPGAGSSGGEVIYAGTPAKLLASKLLTGQYLSGKKRVFEKTKFRKPGKQKLIVWGASEHNLKNIKVEFPLGMFISVAGVSGSGKSSLVRDILVKSLARHFYNAKAEPGKYEKITGIEYIDKIISVNQDAIGRTPRSNAATYTGIFGLIREVFADTDEAKRLKYTASHFSFNMRGGRCEVCQGGGVRKVEMYLLPDVYMPCEACKGTRYNEKTLSVEYRGVNIAQVLAMSVTDARSFFLDQPAIEEKLAVLEEVGLGYLLLGQSATSLSGGEAQRIKLATELARKSTGKTLYVLDEPTIGLHFEDVRRLLGVLEALVEKGNTVIVVEHNTDVIEASDWVIELGPDGGRLGGEILFTGTPNDLRKSSKSITRPYLSPAKKK